MSLDLNYRAALWQKPAAGDAFRTLVRQADVVFAGDDEAAIAVGEAAEPIELAHRLAALGPAQVVIKLGAQGCVALVDGEEYRQDAVPVRAVDTVGAGDAFVGGYLAELLDGRPVSGAHSSVLSTEDQHRAMGMVDGLGRMDPRIKPVNPPRPREPMATTSASREASISTEAGLP